jgi:MFS family permease
VSERATTATWYGLTGVMNALWGATLPATDARLDLGAGAIGGVLTAMAAGALVAMPVAGRVARRCPGRTLRVTALTAALALLGPAIAPTGQVLVVAAFVLGLAFGALNVALSLQAVAVERALGRLVIATMHGTWTLGAVAGGAAVTAGLRGGVNVQVLMVTGAVAVAAVAMVVGRRPSTVAPPVTTTATRPGAVVLLGLVGAAAFVTEGAATDWAGVHATRVLGADPATASLVYTVFFAAMTVVRFAGDAVRTRLGGPVTIRVAGGVATAGYAFVLLAGTPATAVVGWVLAGAGMAMVWPVVVSSLGGAAGRLSAVTMLSYGGGLVGPALIGFVADRSTLPVALLIPAALAAAVTVLAPLVLPQEMEKSCSATRSTTTRPDPAR